MPNDKYPQIISKVVGEPLETVPMHDPTNIEFEQPPFSVVSPADNQPGHIDDNPKPDEGHHSKARRFIALGAATAALLAGASWLESHYGDGAPAPTHDVLVEKANQLLSGQVEETVRHAVNAVAHDPAYSGTYEKSNDGFYLGNKPAFNAEKFAGKDKKFGTADDPLFTPSEIDVNYSQTDNKLYVLSAQETNRRKGEEYGDFTTQQITITPDGVLQNPEDIAKMLDEGTFTVERVAVEYPDGSDQVSTVLIRDSVTDKWTLAIAEDPKLSLTGEWTIKDLEDAVADEHDFFEGQTTIAHETDQQYPELAENARKIIDKADNNTTGQ